MVEKAGIHLLAFSFTGLGVKEELVTFDYKCCKILVAALTGGVLTGGVGEEATVHCVSFHVLLGASGRTLDREGFTVFDGHLLIGSAECNKSDRLNANLIIQVFVLF